MSAASPEEDTVLPSTETDGAPQDERATQAVGQDEGKAEEKPVLPDEQRRAIRSVLEALLDYRDETGHDPSKVFHKRVNKRFVPDYYDVIEEPIAFSNLKAKIATSEYERFTDFVRDCALIWHNAHTYNRPDAGAYQDASTMKTLMEKEFQKLVEEKIISTEDAMWPDLGEIPPVEDAPPTGEGEEEDDDDDEEEEEVEGGDNVIKKRRGRPPLSATRRDTLDSDTGKPELTGKKRRGRPPKVDTPNEVRIKNVLKGVRRIKNDEGSLIYTFERLPERTAMPEYYATIKHPMSLDQIKKSLKRKRYQTLEAFMKHMDLMFDNAKLYNEDDSQIHKDAVALQKEAHRLAEIERHKDDTEFAMDEGRKPRPNGIMHKGELWKVGDWVHITNANDMTKPIVAQIYRTWEDPMGQEWLNVCWYYRPEQTVHHYEKHFYPDEVMKTGQYRDHPIDDVIERCFVMFFTRYPKGRPRGLSADTHIYVCEARYNEEKHKMNKIKTWASCLPDEVRDKDYEMDVFRAPRRVKKIPSPLLFMLEEEGKVTEEPPQPKWGMENAPPIVGGIYKGPREEHQSPPPEPTPSPPPQPPPKAAPETITSQNPDVFGKPDDPFKRATMTFGDQGAQARASETSQHQQTLTPAPRQFQTPSGVMPTPSHITPSYAVQGDSGYAQPQQQQYTPSHSYGDHYSTPQQQQQRYTQQAQPPPPRYNPMLPTPGGPRLPDAFVLTDTENARIPPEVREQYHRDDEGRVMFFTKPPAIVLPPPHRASLLGHTVAYQAAKIRREEALRERKLQREAERTEAAAKRRKVEDARQAEAEEARVFGELKDEMWQKFARQLQEGTDELLKSTYGAGWEQAKQFNVDKLRAMQLMARQQALKIAESEEESLVRTLEEKRKLLQDTTVYLDDGDPRLAR